MNRKNTNCSVQSLTLIELLVVVAIIATLAALLLPTILRVIHRIRTSLATICYLTEDGTLYLTNDIGSWPLQIFEGRAGTPRWSPLGDKIAFETRDETNNLIVVILNPVSKRFKAFPSIEQGAYWADNDHFIHCGVWGSKAIYIRSAETGEVTKKINYSDVEIGWEVSPYSDFLEGYVVSEKEANRSPYTDIYIRDVNFVKRRVIWEDPLNDTEDHLPQIDQSEMWVAWSRGKSPGVNANRAVALKQLGAPPSLPPEIVGAQFEDVFFCGWTIHNDLLVNLREEENGPWKLAILNNKGGLIRIIETPKGLTQGYAASYKLNRRF